jgi:putative ABC transport system substrate-binding protein
VWRVAIIDSQDTEPYTTIRKHFIETLSKFDLKEGQNLEIKFHSIGNRKGTIKNIWKHILKDRVDIIYVGGTIATIGAYQYVDDPNIPIIFVAPTDPVGIGVIKDFESAPYKQFTGICFPVKVERRIDFVKELFPNAKNLALIYADMPQSHSYKKWLQTLNQKEDYRDLNFLYKKVQFIQSERGQERMAFLAQRQAKKIDKIVDVYLSPNDQLGTQKPFTNKLTKVTKKPIIGLVKKDIVNHWGALATMSPSLKDIGYKAAVMVKKLTNGVPIKDIRPQWPDVEIHISKKKAKELGYKVPKKFEKYLVD